MNKSRWMRSVLIAVMLLVCFTLGNAFASESDPVDNPDATWQNVPYEAVELPADAQAAFDKALEGLVGAEYVPVALMSMQPLDGTNYCILCQITPVVPDATPNWALVYIHADADGSARIVNVYELYIDRHSK